MVDHYPLGAIYVLTAMTYMMTIVSIISSVCLTQPAISDIKTEQQVYKTDSMHKTNYYKPVYIDSYSQDKSESSHTTLMLVTFPKQR